MRILGIDPGSQVTGYGIIDTNGSSSFLTHIDNGGIFTRREDPFPQRLEIIFEGLSELIQRYQPDAVAVENIFYAKNVKSTVQLGHARGVALVAATRQKVEVYEYTPLAIKQALVGYGRATKEQIQHMVRNLLKLPEPPYFDASDALAVAICHSHSVSFSKKIQAMGGRK